MFLETLLTEIEEEFSQYKNVNLLDRPSMYRWAYIALKKLGHLICTGREGVFEVKNGMVKLPEGFHSLNLALKVEPNGYSVKDSSENGIVAIQKTLSKKSEWVECKECSEKVTEDTVVETIEIGGVDVDFMYNSPQYLSFGKSFRGDGCTRDSKNRFIKKSPYEMVLNGNTMYTNFNSGYVFIRYYGLEEDEKGLPIVTDTPKGSVINYVESYLKFRIIQKLLLGGDDVNLITFFKHYEYQQEVDFAKAKTELKFLTLGFDSYKKIAHGNQRRMNNIKSLLPNF